MTRSALIRQLLDHPVIDGDGHYVDPAAPFEAFVRDAGYSDLADRCPVFAVPSRQVEIGGMPYAERRRLGVNAPAFLVLPGETRYLATVATPELYAERLGEAGIDFSVLYPTKGLGFFETPEEDRAMLCRLFNEYLVEIYGKHFDRFAPAAIIPMHTPEEAIAGLEHAASIGLKVALLASYVWRPLDEGSAPYHRWLDTYGIDSQHDYDPVWSKAVQLGLPVAFHSPGLGFVDRNSPSNFVYNHCGHFGAAGEAVAKSLVLGGVLQRFPQLRVTLLEGGVVNGVRLLVDLVGRWHKRGRQGMAKLHPGNLDLRALGDLLSAYHSPSAPFPPEQVLGDADWSLAESAPDDFAPIGADGINEICKVFATNLFWGCEADDPLVGLAFDTKVTPGATRVPAVMGSDVGHWDVTHFDSPLAETWELVEKGILDADQLRDFVFTNAVRLYGDPSGQFFRGTAIEREVATAFPGMGDSASRSEARV
jgi:predicted TIM-barrel fold metal-dependent hydrolase